jgi:hypothetical protein
MSFRVSVAVTVALFGPALWTSAQTLPAAESIVVAEPRGIEPSIGATPPGTEPAPTAPDAQLGVPPEPTPGVTFGAPAPRNPFTSIGHDLKHFFSRDTAMVMGLMAPIAGVAFTWDQAGIEESQEHLDSGSFQPGNIGGSFLVQTGASVATWAVGKMSGSRKTTEVGGDLVRAQFVSQVIVQGAKLVTRRERPDESNNQSFPSGHTSSAFATASVLERHFGWKAGLPAYGFATYVGMARMSANKHHLSDVIMGAAVGIAAGRTVTMGIAGATFDLGVAPTPGGAAVTFTKR